MINATRWGNIREPLSRAYLNISMSRVNVIPSFFRSIPVAATFLLLSACGGGSGDSAPAPSACSADGQKQFVLDVMEDVYFWNDQLPQVNLDDFATAEELLAALLFQPLDRFSFIGSAAADSAFFGEGQFVGFGFSWRFVAQDDDVRLTQVFTDGPAGAAGLQRGYRILEIDGRTIAEINAAEGVSAAFGPAEIGLQVDLKIADLGGVESDISMIKDVVTIDPVPVSAIFDVNGTPVGYLLLASFISPAVDSLNQTFADFNAAGVSDVILDMRYNGGGLISTAEFLGNLLGGLTANGDIFSSQVFNANNAFRNTTTLFVNEVESADLQRLVIITTGSTASASEIIINSMLPHVEVATVGEASLGKPVGQLGFEFCEKILRPISFQTVNSLGEGDYFDGFQPTCAAEDDVDFLLGDPTEPSLAEALTYVETGACTPVAQKPARQTRDFKTVPAYLADPHPARRLLDAY